MSYTIKAQHQGPRRHSAVQIVVNGLAGRTGEDVTSKLHPYLISVQVIDTTSGQDQCNIELDDRNAELQLPPDRVRLQVAMGWSGVGPRLPDRGRSSLIASRLNQTQALQLGGQGPMTMPERYLTPGAPNAEQPWGGGGMGLVFDGTVTEVESGFGRRGGGRRVWITATSGNVLAPTKEVGQQTLGSGRPDDGQDGEQIPLKNFMQKIFATTGMQVKISPEMAKITRNFWNSNQSPMDWGMEFARTNGGIFKIAGGVAMLTKVGENVDRDKMPSVEAIWGVNLIGWRIRPYTGRPQWGGAQARFFDLASGTWDKVDQAIGGSTPFGAAKAISKLVHTVADKATGQQANKGTEQSSLTNRGTGWALINGEPEAKANGYVIIDRARPGVDGTYQISEVEHNYQRGVGYTTRMNVKYPSPKAGGYGWDNDPGFGQPKKPVPTPPATPAIPPDDPFNDPNAGIPITEESIFMPGRSPAENLRRLLGARAKPLTPEEKSRAQQWFINRNMPIPPEFQ